MMGCLARVGASSVVPLLSMWPGKKMFADVVDVAIDSADEKAAAHVVALEEALDRNAMLIAAALAGVAAALLVLAVTRL